MNAFYDSAIQLLGLGLEPKELTFMQLSLPLMAREKTAFDAILLVILASVLSRAINGTAGFFTSIGCSFVLVFLHRFFGWIACRWHAFGKIIKGCPAVIVENGLMNRQAMRENLISDHDLEEDLRLAAETEELVKIKIARLERSGDISFIKADS